MKQRLTLLLILVSAAFTACTSGKSALKHGDYYNAVLQSVNRLRQKPDHEDAARVLQNAYPMAVEDIQRDIERTKASTSPQKWNVVYDQMQRVNHLAEEIYHCPAAKRLIPQPFEYNVATLENVKEEAVKELYQDALALYNAGGRENAKRAINELEKLLDFAPGHNQAIQLLQQAEEAATLHIVVEMLPYQHKKYELSDEAFRNEINNHIASLDRKYKYIKVYSPTQAERLNLSPDQVITVDWVNFMVGNTNQKQIEREVTSADSVKVGETTVNGVVYPVYNRVSAKLNINIMEIVSNGKMSIKAKEFKTQRVITNDAPSGSYVWRYEWGSFNGDERALSKEEKEICKNKPPVIPSPQFLFTELTRPLYDQTASWFDRYFRKYQ